jgi:hypothetical protein
MNVSASKAVCERWSYGSIGTMGIAICWSGPVTVWCGIGIGMYDMVLVSKCSMALCGLAGRGECIGVEWAHARDDNGKTPAMGKERPSAQWQARDVVLVGVVARGSGVEGGEMRQAGAEKTGTNTAEAQSQLGSDTGLQQYRR